MAVSFSIRHPWSAAAGHIVTTYAAVESELDLLLSAVLEISIYELAVLTECYTASQRRNVFKALIKMKLPPTDGRRNQLLGFAGRFKQCSTIRNHLAHARWVKGERPESFKPHYVKVQDGKARYIGGDAGEEDYTIKELLSIGGTLESLLQEMIEFKSSSGYFEAINRNMNRPRYG